MKERATRCTKSLIAAITSGLPHRDADVLLDAARCFASNRVLLVSAVSIPAFPIFRNNAQFIAIPRPRPIGITAGDRDVVAGILLAAARFTVRYLLQAIAVGPSVVIVSAVPRSLGCKPLRKPLGQGLSQDWEACADDADVRLDHLEQIG